MSVGILGGGQLARMMAEAGQALSLDCVALDPSPDACAGAYARLVTADYDDRAALQQLVDDCERVTFDFENVPEASARWVAEQRPFHPTPEALAATQDRLVEKRLLNQLDIATPRFYPVDSRTDLMAAIEELGYPAVLKTRRMGYDGKGQAVLRDAEDLERAWHRLGDHALILEEFVPFDCECSIIAARSLDGSTRFWPAPRNLHADGVLAISVAPWFDAALQSEAEQMATRLLDHFSYAGVLTLELFVSQGRLLANEIAPRVHNSGHWTIEGATTSQFENHLRAIHGMPLGETAVTGHCLMLNFLGELPDRDALEQVPGLSWHDYQKAARPGRKIGHATIVADTREALASAAMQAAQHLDERRRTALGKLFE